MHAKVGKQDLCKKYHLWISLLVPAHMWAFGGPELSMTLPETETWSVSVRYSPCGIQSKDYLHDEISILVIFISSWTFSRD